MEVTLDPDMVHQHVYISDLKPVFYRNISQKAISLEKRSLRKCVVASQGIQEGKHYWEVDVGFNKMWCLGVCRDDVNREVTDVTLSPNNGYWVLGRERDDQYFTFNPHRIILFPRTDPTRVGVFLDYEGGAISFFNINDQSFIYTLTHRFEGLLRPYIQYDVNDEENVTSTEICPVSQESKKKVLSDTDNLEPSPQVTILFLSEVMPCGNHTSHSPSRH